MDKMRDLIDKMKDLQREIDNVKDSIDIKSINKDNLKRIRNDSSREISTRFD